MPTVAGGDGLLSRPTLPLRLRRELSPADGQTKQTIAQRFFRPGESASTSELSELWVSRPGAGRRGRAAGPTRHRGQFSRSGNRHPGPAGRNAAATSTYGSPADKPECRERRRRGRSLPTACRTSRGHTQEPVSHRLIYPVPRRRRCALHTTEQCTRPDQTCLLLARGCRPGRLTHSRSVRSKSRLCARPTAPNGPASSRTGSWLRRSPGCSLLAWTRRSIGTRRFYR